MLETDVRGNEKAAGLSELVPSSSPDNLVEVGCMLWGEEATSFSEVCVSEMTKMRSDFKSCLSFPLAAEPRAAALAKSSLSSSISSESSGALILNAGFSCNGIVEDSVRATCGTLLSDFASVAEVTAQNLLSGPDAMALETTDFEGPFPWISCF